MSEAGGRHELRGQSSIDCPVSPVSVFNKALSLPIIAVLPQFQYSWALVVETRHRGAGLRWARARIILDGEEPLAPARRGARIGSNVDESSWRHCLAAGSGGRRHRAPLCVGR